MKYDYNHQRLDKLNFIPLEITAIDDYPENIP